MSHRSSRRTFIKTTLASGVALALPAVPGQSAGQAPAVVTSDRMRPQATSGLQIGDVTGSRALVWSRSDRPAPDGRVNVPPTEGGQFYGLAKIDGKSGMLKVQIKDLNGATLFEKSIAPQV